MAGRLTGGILGLAVTCLVALVALSFGRGPAPSATPAYAFDPPSSGLYLALDCDEGSPGIQDSCYLMAPFSRNVAVVLGNVDVTGLQVGAFNFEVHGTLSYLAPLPATGDPDNSNPDFNQSAFPPEFRCDAHPTLLPNPDIDPGPLTASRLICFTEGPSVAVPAGSTLTLGYVKYVSQTAPPGDYANPLSLANVSLGNHEGDEILSCNPVNQVAGPCSGTNVIVAVHVFPTATYTRTATPTPTFTATPTATPTPLPDADGDGVPDASDNCVTTPNAGQEQGDGNITILAPDKPYNDHTWPKSDTTGDACDIDGDKDDDGRSDADETAGADGCAITNPLLRDSDGDRMLDAAECALGTNPNAVNAAPAACAAPGDADTDGVVDAREFCYYGTSSASTNSDGDACSDAKEVASINGDTTVSAIDLSQVAQAFGPYTVPNAPYRLNFDITKDGSISATDLSQVAQRFGPC